MKKLFVIFLSVVSCCIALCSCHNKGARRGDISTSTSHSHEYMKNNTESDLPKDIKDNTKFFVFTRTTETEGQGSDDNSSKSTPNNGGVELSSEQSFNYNLRPGEQAIFSQTYIKNSITLDKYQKSKKHWASYCFTSEEDVRDKILKTLQYTNIGIGSANNISAVGSQVIFFTQCSNKENLVYSENDLNSHDGSASSAFLITIGKVDTQFFGSSRSLDSVITETVRSISETGLLPPPTERETLPFGKQEN